MLEKITQAALLSAVGGSIGYAIKAYEERPQPGLIIENIELSRETGNKLGDVAIPNDVKELETKCNWIQSLPSKMEYAKFESMLRSFSDCVEGLEELCQGLSTMHNFVKDHLGENNYDTEWRTFLRTSAISDRALNLFFSNVEGCVKRNELKLEQIKNQFPDALSEETANDILRPQEKSETVSGKEDKAQRIAKAMYKYWFPFDFREAVEVISLQLPGQLTISQQLLEKLINIDSELKYLAASNLAFVDALLVNNGRTTIAFDNNAVIAISGIRKAFFLKVEDNHQKISVPARGTVGITLRSNPIDEEQFRALEELQKYKLKCSLKMRIIRSTRRSQRWVLSPDTEFSQNLDDVEKEFLLHAHFPSES
jgi:hypothetical protein